jgi:hypothetical protein
MGSLRGNSTFLKSYHSMGNVELNIPHYSLLARGQALRRRFVEHCSWEDAMPTLKHPNRVPDASTIRRWSRPGSLSTGFFVPAPNAGSHCLLAGVWSRRSRSLAVALPKSDSADSRAAASLRRIFFHLPSLPVNAGELLLRSAFGGKQHRGRGCRTTQTALAAARLLTTAELGRPASGLRLRVRRTLSATPGDAAFVLCQRP